MKLRRNKKYLDLSVDKKTCNIIQKNKKLRKESKKAKELLK